MDLDTVLQVNNKYKLFTRDFLIKVNVYNPCQYQMEFQRSFIHEKWMELGHFFGEMSRTSQSDSQLQKTEMHISFDKVLKCSQKVFLVIFRYFLGILVGIPC